jgi:protein-arginine kinase activator protein McsA
MLNKMSGRELIFRSAIYIRKGNGFVLYKQKKRIDVISEISTLEWLLAKMIKIEEYEMAAIIRDKINKLQAEIITGK